MKTVYILRLGLLSLVIAALMVPVSLFADGDTEYIKINNSYHTHLDDIVTISDLSAAEDDGVLVNKKSKKIRYAKVEVIYGRELKTDLLGDDWEYRLFVEIKNSAGQIIGTPLLHVETGGQAKYRSSFRVPLHLSESVSYTITQVYASNGTLTGTDGELFEITGGGGELIREILPQDIRIEFSIETEKYYFLDQNDAPTLTVDSENFSYNKANPNAVQTVDLFWEYIWGAEEYEVQIAFIDANTEEEPAGLAVFENSISINTTNTWYKPEIIYPAGKVYFRVRPIGRYIYGTGIANYTKIKLGAWSPFSLQNHRLIIPEETSGNPETGGFEKEYNWQLSQTFAEDGKRKSVISYYDQSLRSRQVQTNLSTEDATLVAENKYDYEGRPSLSILPVPAMNAASDGLVNDLFYKGAEGANLFKGLNKNESGISYEKINFDKTTFADALGEANGEGAATYFSENNALENIHTGLIPNAEGYPITQTRYSRDGTGRVTKQGGVGPEFQINGGHDTKYIYASANATELRRLFGSNVGEASHYKKNYVVDANGQVSVSYLDMAGRVIATALSEKAPDELEAIYEGTEGNIIANLNEHHQLDLENRVSTLDYTFALPLEKADDVSYTFTYDLTGVNQSLPTIPFEDEGTFCEECVYRLSMKVIDPDGEVVAATDDSTPNIVTGIEFNGNLSCDNSTYGEAAILEVDISKAGEYRLIKTLELLTPPYDLDYLVENNLIEDPEVEIQTYLEDNPINPMECIVNCEQCVELLNLHIPDDPSSIPWATVQGWYNECLAAKCPCTSCEEVQTEGYPTALADCYANCGQYEIDQAEQETAYKEYRCGGMYEMMRADVNVGGWLFESELWMNLAIILEGGSVEGHTTPSDLRDNWEDDWADIIVKYHREYCHYEFCDDSNDFDYDSDRFNRSLQKAGKYWKDNGDITWAEIVANLENDDNHPLHSLAGFIEESNNTITSINWSQEDPFFTGLVGSPATTYTLEMASVLGSFYNPNPGNIPPQHLITFLSDPPAEFEPLTVFQQWNILVGAYVNAKGEVRDQYIENHLDCPFYDDDNAIVSRNNPLPLNYEEAQGEVAGELTEHCNDLCQGSVANWMHMLELQCPTAFNDPNNEGQWEEVRSLLQSYCTNGCLSNVNPLGILAPIPNDFGGPGPYWQLVLDAELIIDGLFGNSTTCPNPNPNDYDPDPNGLLNDNDPTQLNPEFESNVTYTYTEVPVGEGPSCEPCDVIRSFIDFGEWVLIDEDNQSYEWVPGHWNIAGLKDYMLAANINYNITPFDIIEAIRQCNELDPGYSFHNADEFCSNYNDTANLLLSERGINSYLNNFLGCYGIWSIEGYDPNLGPSICSGSANGLSLGEMEDLYLDMEACAKAKLEPYLPVDAASTAAFNYDYNTNLTVTDLYNIAQLYIGNVCSGNPPVVPFAGRVCHWTGFTVDLYDDIDKQHPCRGITVMVTGMETNYTWTNAADLADCIETLSNQVTFNFNEYYSDLIDQTLTGLNQQRVDNCFSAANGFAENLYMNYFDLEYQYTLYYYDQAGNLIQTVPPEGVNRKDDAFNAAGEWDGTNPSHTRVTRYQYNSLNQVVAQSTPETRHPDSNPNLSLNGSEFVYDYLSRLRFSQDAEQKFITNNDPNEDPQKYSYTKYDDLGRIVEVGQMEDFNGPIEELIELANDPNFPFESDPDYTYTLTEVIKTYYDTPGPELFANQKNLRNRVSYTENDDILTEYSYDAHGNVRLLAHELKDPAIPGHQQRYGIEYKYDLISGNVNEVIFKPGVTGTAGHRRGIFHHRYEYDADNRLTHVHTSKDGVIWNNDARYLYYLHGPLARIELGEDKVQGLDYYYSLQGWIKGVNDPYGGDFSDDGTGSEENKWIAKDEMAYRLGYFQNDYQPINNANLASNQLYFASLSGNDLYNGNISAMETNIAHFDVAGPSNPALQKRTFEYDQLHRIITSVSAEGTDQFASGGGGGGLAYVGTDDYGTTYEYDKNGNLESMTRRAKGNGEIDNLEYHYKDENTGNLDHANLLNWVEDSPAGTATEGVVGQSSGNYTYDKIGNLIKDEGGAVQKIRWNLQGKVEEVFFDQSATPSPPYVSVRFTYDAQGNRLSKTLNYGTSTSSKYYIRDASGNVMAIYEDDKDPGNFGGITQIELPLFGSSRVGVNNVSDRAVTALIANQKGYNFVASGDRGDKNYELSNHLGNVLAVVSDKKLGYSNTPSGLVADFYEADVLSANDYYPFGMGMPQRTYNSPDYRYGFNGKEKDENGEFGNLTNYDYGFRIYNPGIGRFLSVDPLTRGYPMLTPYQFASNRPIDGVDLDGLEYYWFVPIEVDKSGNCFYKLVKTQDVIALQTGVGIVELNLKRFGITGTFAKHGDHWRLVPENQLNRSLNDFSENEWNSFLTYEEIEMRVGAAVALGKKAESAVAMAQLADGVKNILQGGQGLLKLLKDKKLFRETVAEIWKNANVLRRFKGASRGEIFENLLQHTRYKNARRVGHLDNGFFPTIDFVENGVGISLKTTTAKKGSKAFDSIKTNIDKLANAKATGVIRNRTGNVSVKDVRLDIAVPKGYDKSNLTDVLNHAKSKGVKVNIFNVENHFN